MKTNKRKLTVDHKRWHEVWMHAAFEQMVRADRAEAELSRLRSALRAVSAVVDRVDTARS